MSQGSRNSQGTSRQQPVLCWVRPHASLRSLDGPARVISNLRCREGGGLSRATQLLMAELGFKPWSLQLQNPSRSYPDKLPWFCTSWHGGSFKLFPLLLLSPSILNFCWKMAALLSLHSAKHCRTFHAPKSALGCFSRLVLHGVVCSPLVVLEEF